MRVESFASGRPEMRQTLDRREKFLNLSRAGPHCSRGGRGHRIARLANGHLDDLRDARVLGPVAAQAIALAILVEFHARGRASRAWPVWRSAFRCHYVFGVLLAGLVDASLPAATVWPGPLRVGVASRC